MCLPVVSPERVVFSEGAHELCPPTTSIDVLVNGNAIVMLRDATLLSSSVLRAEENGHLFLEQVRFLDDAFAVASERARIEINHSFMKSSQSIQCREMSTCLLQNVFFTSGILIESAQIGTMISESSFGYFLLLNFAIVVFTLLATRRREKRY